MKSSTRIVIVSLITLIFTAALVYEVYLISSTQGELNNTTTSTDEEIESDRRAKSIIELQKESKTELAIVDEVLLTKSDLVELVEKLEKTGRDLGLIVSISSITNDSKTSSSQNPETVRISIETRGAWAQNLKFVRLVETLPHKFAIDRLDLNFDGQDWRTLVNLRVTTYPERQ